MSQQHCRTTLAQAIAQYKSRCLTAKGLLMYFFMIKLKPGCWTRTWTIKELLAQLPIGKSTFYKYISELRAEKAIIWEVPDSTQFTISIPNGDPDKDNPDIWDEEETSGKGFEDSPPISRQEFLASASQSTSGGLDPTNGENSYRQGGKPSIRNSGDKEKPTSRGQKNLPPHSTTVESQSTGVENQSTIAETQSTGVENQSAPVENKPSKLPSGKGFGSPSTSFQSFINSLSEREREAFIRYVKERTSTFPKPIANHMAWLASADPSGQPRYKDLYGDFQRSSEGQEIAKAKAKEMLTDELREEYAKEMDEYEQKYDTQSVFNKRTRKAYGTPEYHVRMAYQMEWYANRRRKEVANDIAKHGLRKIADTFGISSICEALNKCREEILDLLNSGEDIYALP
ncbi:MAG: hypothetical protein J7525_19595 [Roseofilum sp. SID3]|uniref:hypothetical protein n=1 Tax=Roseofilum sp. SID3 TaxID=2821499 RepID=UPI001B21B1F0|nr:hypothetical protein [Roseofilum sp. SID3]MBP0015300.1 hypothetical protein [Roseofilum sp. SID3]